MRPCQIVPVLFLSILLTGCSQNNKSKTDNATGAAALPAHILTPSELQNRPEVAAVGVVFAVITDLPLADIREIPVKDLKEGDYINILSPTGTVIAISQVTAVLEKSVQVLYHPVEGQRPPQQGDLAVKFKK